MHPFVPNTTALLQKGYVGMWSNCVGFWRSDDHRVRQLFARESRADCENRTQMGGKTAPHLRGGRGLDGQSAMGRTSEEQSTQPKQKQEEWKMTGTVKKE